MSGKKPAKVATRSIIQDQKEDNIPVEIEYLSFGYENEDCKQPIMVKTNFGRVEASTHSELVDKMVNEFDDIPLLAGRSCAALFGIEYRRINHPVFENYFKFFSLDEAARLKKKIAIRETH